MSAPPVNAPLTLSEIQQRLDASPFSRFLQLTVTALDAARGELEMRMPMRPEIERIASTGQYHGGAIASLIDVAGDLALVVTVRDAVPTINYRVDYLRPATGRALTATARVRRAGRSIGVVDIDVVDDMGNIVAVGRGCYGTKPG